MDYMNVESILKLHEGYRRKPYVCPAGKLTVGYGINLEEGISEKEASVLLHMRVLELEAALHKQYPWFSKLCGEHQGVLVNMAYNLGLAGLGKFKNMLAAWEQGDYDRVVAEMQNSRWYSQVGSRAKELIRIVQLNA